MKRILLFGAGKSATVLINYLLDHASNEGWELTVADANLRLATEKIKNSPFGRPVSFDISDDTQRRERIKQADIVISMLPAILHSKVARDCLAFSKHLLTASYVDDEMRSMKEEINKKGLLFLCEMGLDPGIDHMSAMKIIDAIHTEGGSIHSFKSHCGGLVAPESDDNPWHYKISWNPRNVVTAGKAGAVLKKDARIVSVPYDQLFEDNKTVQVPGLGDYAFYPNRDSLSYIPLYGLEETSTFFRTTLRHPDFCKGWNYVIKSGLTSEDNATFFTGKLSFREWLDRSIAGKTKLPGFAEFLQQEVNPAEQKLVKKLFDFLGLFSDEAVPSSARSAADVLQFAIETKLSLKPNDQDMIIMLHEFEFTIENKPKVTTSSLVVKGDNSLETAMAKTVGLPLGIAAKLILNGTIKTRGLQIPVVKEIYEPVLKELAQYGVVFNEMNG